MANPPPGPRFSIPEPPDQRSGLHSPPPAPHAPHLRRLAQVWIKHPVYFITSCTAGRASLLATDVAHAILRAEWLAAETRHGWRVGRYVVMPDHVHFFAMPGPAAKPLAAFMRQWKEWTAKQILAVARCPAPLWQPKFFDHVLRSRDSYGEKWTYVAENPVRACLVSNAESWPYAGRIHFDEPL